MQSVSSAHERSLNPSLTTSKLISEYIAILALRLFFAFCKCQLHYTQVQFHCFMWIKTVIISGYGYILQKHIFNSVVISCTLQRPYLNSSHECHKKTIITEKYWGLTCTWVKLTRIMSILLFLNDIVLNIYSFFTVRKNILCFFQSIDFIYCLYFKEVFFVNRACFV